MHSLSPDALRRAFRAAAWLSRQARRAGLDELAERKAEEARDFAALWRLRVRRPAQGRRRP